MSPNNAGAAARGLTRDVTLEQRGWAFVQGQVTTATEGANPSSRTLPFFMGLLLGFSSALAIVGLFLGWAG